MSSGQARYLRNNSLLPEVLLWNRLKHDQIGYQFRRQFEFDNYILDFYCPKLRFAIEIDGKIHELSKERDLERDTYLACEYITIMGISAQSVLSDSFSVAMRIKDFCIFLSSGSDSQQDFDSQSETPAPDTRVN